MRRDGRLMSGSPGLGPTQAEGGPPRGERLLQEGKGGHDQLVPPRRAGELQRADLHSQAENTLGADLPP